MLARKTRYAILALVRLAREYGDGPVLISDIATSEKIPQRFLENILLELKNIGILGSRLGKSGGYYLVHDPADVNLMIVVRHFEGTIALLPCVSEKAYQSCEFCKDEDNCKIKHVFKEVRNTTFGILEKTSLKDLL